MWEMGLEQYAQEVGIDWQWQAMDGAMVKARLGEKSTGANPTDRGKTGTKRSVLSDGNGIPIGVAIEGANRHNMKMTQATLEAQRMLPSEHEAEPVQNLCLDKGYDYEEVREILTAWEYIGDIPPRARREQMIDEIPNYRARRWVVEPTHSWMNRFCRLSSRWEKKPENYLATIHLACACIVVKAIQVFG